MMKFLSLLEKCMILLFKGNVTDKKGAVIKLSGIDIGMRGEGSKNFI